MFGKEDLWRPELRGKETPEPAAADLRAPAVQAGHGPARMFPRWFAERTAKLKPIAYGGNLAKGHARLDHAEGPGIHAEEHNRAACRERGQISGVAVSLKNKTG